MSPRILHLLPQDGIGGAEVAARSGVRDDGTLRVHFLQRARADAPPLARFVTHGTSDSSFSPHAIREALAVARAAPPDLILVSMWRCTPAALALKAAFPRVPLVLMFHCHRVVSLPDRLGASVLRRVARECWADSPATLAARLGDAADEGRVVSFVLAAPDPVTSPAPRPHFVFWGRLIAAKGLDRALRVIGALRARGVAARFTIVGPDEGEGAALKAQAADLRIADAVTFAGASDRAGIAQAAAEASFYLQPSRFEGMAMSVVEAMSAGLVPVVTPVGGIADYARDGENALVYDGDDAEGVAARVAALLAHPTRFGAMREAAIATFAGRGTYADSIRANARAALERG